MTAELAVAALRNTVALRDPVGTTLHSDRGSQFRSRKFDRATQAGRDHRVNGPRWRVRRLAVMGPFSLLQKNVVNKQRWQSKQELRLEIVTWIERTHHHRRRQRRHRRLTPIEFEIVNGEAAHAGPKAQQDESTESSAVVGLDAHTSSPGTS